jgi:two-component system, NtrC family, sensor kinase
MTTLFRIPDNATNSQLQEIVQNQLGILCAGDEGMLVLDDEGVILFANRALGDFLEADPDKMTNRNFAEYLPPMQADVFHHCHREVIDNPAKQFHTVSIPHKDSKRTLEITTRRQAGDGKPTYVFFRDVTRRINVEEQLRRRNAFYNSVIENSVDGIIAADMKGNIILFNRSAQQLLGYTEEEARTSIHTTKLYPKGVAQEIMRKLRSEEFGGKGRCIKHRLIGLSKSGEEIPLSLSGSIIYDHDEIEQASFGIFTDLRQYEEMEKRLKEKQMELIQTEKMASLGKLAAGVAHEINNPLSGVLIYANLVLEELDEKNEVREDMERIIHETRRCKDIVRELLDFARQDESCCESGHANRIIEGAIQLLRNQAIFQNLNIELDLMPRLPPISGTATRLNQVILNLVLNAAEAMEGQGTLRFVTRSVDNNSKIQIKIADTGCGIPPEIQSKIFDPFFTTKEIGKGTGLGLSICYRIMRDCGGTIEVESKSGEGTTFILELPTVLDNPQVETEAEAR